MRVRPQTEGSATGGVSGATDTARPCAPSPAIVDQHVLLVGSSGGHLTQLRALGPWLDWAYASLEQ